MENLEKVKINTKSIVFKGIPSSSGIAMGKVFVIKFEISNSSKIGKKKLHKSKIDIEIKRFNTTVETVKSEFETLISKQSSDIQSVKNILESSLLILEDPIFHENIINEINQGYNCEEAIIKEVEKQKSYFKKSKDFILREKAAEFDEIKSLLLSSYNNINLEQDIPINSVVITQSINPTQVVKLKEKNIKGLITELGGLGSHSSILCRSFEIPQVVGVNNICSKIKNNDDIIIDGFNGEIILNPTQEQVAIYENKINELKKHKSTIGKLAKLPSITSDGRELPLLSNIDLPTDIDNSLIYGAEGFGLVRSESMMLIRDTIPSEEEQYQWYNEISERAFPLNATIRLFDFGSDKYTEGLANVEENPALGLRGIRYLLAKPEILETQIRAILRASKNSNIKIMVPMVSNLEEFLEVKSRVRAISNQLAAEDIDYDSMIKLGTMIETPAAAMISDDLAEVCDFFSIGTNDLIQYTMAADRNNQYVTNIYDFFQPAVIRIINQIIINAHSKGKKVSICGEIASHPAATELLIGLGVDELSVIPSGLVETKMRIRNINSANTIDLADYILVCKSAKLIREKVMG